MVRNPYSAQNQWLGIRTRRKNFHGNQYSAQNLSGGTLLGAKLFMGNRSRRKNMLLKQTFLSKKHGFRLRPAHPTTCQVMPPKGTKRTSGSGAAGKAKARKQSQDQLQGLPAGSLQLPHMSIFDQWLVL